MAQKEATVYIIDCGRSMGTRAYDRDETNLHFGLQYVWDKITSTVATGRKTALIGVIGLRTDGTQNELGDDEGYNNLTTFQEIDQILMPQVHGLREQIVVSNTNRGDAISALILAIQMIATKCKKLQYQRKIVLVTDGLGSMDIGDSDGIVAKMKEDGIEFVVLGVDFDDADYGFKEEDKDHTKAANETALKLICEQCNGTFGTLAQAVAELQIPRIKSVRPTPNYRGLLMLGDPEQYNTALSIDVERYPKVMVASAPTASRFVVRSDLAAGEATQSMLVPTSNDAEGSEELATVRNASTYQIVDENAPGGKRDIPPEELAKGYEYGRTAVHISESDRNVTTYETKLRFDIVGFVDAEKYHHYLDMSRSCLTIARRDNKKASMALSSLIHALYEMDSYAIARLVPKDLKEPKMLLLAPNIEPEFECLYDVELPFAEDVRNYRFPPLDRVVTVSGKELRVHRNLPSDALQEAMSVYVDSMDLSAFSKDDEGETVEYMPMDDTFSPVLHRLNQVIRHRAIYPKSEFPPPPEILVKYSRPPSELIERSQGRLAKLSEVADLKKVPPKARGRRFGRGKDAPKPLSDLDVGALLAQDPERESQRINPKNAIPEFKHFLANADQIEQVEDACNQLGKIVFDYIRNSVGDSGYGKAVEAVSAMREEVEGLDFPLLYNGFLKRLKAQIWGGQLGGPRDEMWYRLRSARLRPISKTESLESDMTDEEAKAFMSVKQS